MEPFFRFMASRAGRWVRMVSGAALVALGVATAPLGLILVAIGLGPLVAGATDLCLLAPPFGYPLRGPRLRSALGQPTHVPLIAGPEPS